MSIKENIAFVRKTMEAACKASNRNPDEVTLIAVSKTKPVSMLQEAYDAGCRHFGDNKVQEIMDKYDKLPKDICWHMIGHLQTNKVKYIVDKVSMIHSVDSVKLAKEISKEAMKHARTVDILLEVNVANEESKYGFHNEELMDAVKEVSVLPGLKIRGLMTVAPFVEDAEENRVHFATLNKLLVDINRENIDNVYMDILSMGMTGDYAVAIQEGASLVRVGTGIFGERSYLS